MSVPSEEGTAFERNQCAFHLHGRDGYHADAESLQYCFPKPGSKTESTRLSPDAAIQILAPMWLSFIVGAVAGALLVLSFHTNGLLVIVLPLAALTIAETKRNLSVQL